MSARGSRSALLLALAAACAFAALAHARVELAKPAPRGVPSAGGWLLRADAPLGAPASVEALEPSAGPGLSKEGGTFLSVHRRASELDASPEADLRAPTHTGFRRAPALSVGFVPDRSTAPPRSA